MPPTVATVERAVFVSGLRELADWLEASEEIKVPSSHVMNVFYSSRGDYCRARDSTSIGDDAVAGDFVSCEKYFGPICFAINIDTKDLGERRDNRHYLDLVSSHALQ